jgi:undecaprenyl-phosphate galactose phosphotransferase
MGMPVGNIEAESLFNEKLLLLNVRNNLARRYNRVLKRLFDIALAAAISIPAACVMAVCALWIRLDSQGGIIYAAERIGKNRKKFKCYKFRSMYENADELLEKHLKENEAARKEWKEYAKLKGEDPRVTGAGKWLRKYSMDELPQLINVIKGEMSLVGPRPYLPREEEEMGEYMDTIVLTVPGITGMWQVSGRSEINFKGRLEMDSWYVKNWSVWIDMVYIVKTVKAVLLRKGAY